jgi:branched-chain amino acid aminotransferase
VSREGGPSPIGEGAAEGERPSGREVVADPDRVASDDRAFLLGDGIFETIRVYGGTPFRLDAHLARLAGGAATLGIPVPGDLESRIRQLLERADSRWGGPDFEAALRITVSRGRGGGLGGEGAGDPLAALRLVPLSADVAAPPALSAAIAGRLHEEALSAGIKGVAYLERILALRRARERGADEALLRNSRGLLVEGAASNLVALLPGGILVSPGREEGALAGITRGVVLEEARAMGLEVRERGLAPGDLGEVRELLLTSSIREVACVVRVDGSPVGDGRPGPVGRRLQEALRAVAARETGSG